MKFVLKVRSPEEAVQECAALIDNLAAKHLLLVNTTNSKTLIGRYEAAAHEMVKVAHLLRTQVEIEHVPDQVMP